jgi:uncharacterized membrane protein YkvA (DUF1232 family)
MARSGPAFPGADDEAAERALSDPLAALTFLKDVALLLKDCAVDARVPRTEKWILAGVAAYLLGPIDLISDLVPVLGQMDDLAVTVWALRRLLRAAGHDIITELWRGTDDGLLLVINAAGMQLRKDEA